MYAYAFGNTNQPTWPVAVNGVDFAYASQNGGGTNVTLGVPSPSTRVAGPYFGGMGGLSAGYTAILKGGFWCHTPFALYSLNLNNLTAGTEYAVQVWSLSPVAYGSQNITLDGVTLSSHDGTGTGQYLIGSFTATATTQTISVGPATNAMGPLCAVQVRTVPAPGTPPTVAITSPADNATVGVNFTIDATATDDGTITKVSFFDGTTQLGPDVTDPPYSYAWNGAPEGAHVLTAVAWDNDGMTTTSAEVNVTVIDPPTVAITSPTNNTTMGVNFTIDAAATDNGTV
ncbi:MAG: Ig-like domain-containing protein, partial [Verrucomicrobia bacterium]|nr:Ig-like domain-containing protein [Verrucomicrobiota bacterium]